MIVRSIDSSNDWNFGKGKNDYKKSIDSIVQSLKTRLQSFFGDCFFAMDEGVDWFNLLSGKSKVEVSLAISRVILNTQDVTRIVDLELIMNENNRNLTIRCSVDTIYGLTNNTFQLDLGI